MKTSEKVSYIIWFCLAIYVCIESSRKLPLGSYQNPGAGFFPLIGGILLGILSIIAYLQLLLKKDNSAKESWLPKERWKNIILVLAALFGYAVTLEITGFLVNTFCLLFFLMRAIEPQRWIITFAESLMGSFASYLIFELFLKTQLPKGILGF